MSEVVVGVKSICQDLQNNLQTWRVSLTTLGQIYIELTKQTNHISWLEAPKTTMPFQQMVTIIARDVVDSLTTPTCVLRRPTSTDKNWSIIQSIHNHLPMSLSYLTRNNQTIVHHRTKKTQFFAQDVVEILMTKIHVTLSKISMASLLTDSVFHTQS